LRLDNPVAKVPFARFGRSIMIEIVILWHIPLHQECAFGSRNHSNSMMPFLLATE
jgi:hypothetical protein